MGFRRSGWALAEICLAWILMLAAMASGGRTAYAQVTSAIATTQVTDTVYRADGTAASGTVLISWPAFSTLSGQSVPAGSTSAAIGPGGALSVRLVANAGSNPMGSYYTVVYHLDDGSVTREYWVVPVTTATVAVSAIRSTVLPASVIEMPILGMNSYGRCEDCGKTAPCADVPTSYQAPYWRKWEESNGKAE